MKSSLSYMLAFPMLTYILSCSPDLQHENKFVQWTRNEIPETGLFWPAGQVLPQFATAADTVDAIIIDDPDIPSEDILLLTTLQGSINRTRPRLMLLKNKRGGTEEWADRLSINTKLYPAETRWQLVKKFIGEINGAVIYDTEKSKHYNNLAGTIASIENCIAVTRDEYDILENNGIKLPIVKDIRDLSLTSPIEIYTYLYENYWDKCTKRVLVSLNPNITNDIRDMAVATNAATIWLDPRKEDEKKVLDMFLSDMKAGESIILGWWPEERSGIGSGVSHGISTIPSDFYENSTIHASAKHIVNHAPVPKRDALENKIYISLFLSDGDNVQYCQHSMLRLWLNEARGSIPINWTVSPGLVDIGPDIMNYYYSTATPADCLSSGPSGLGYALIYDAHNDKWFASSREEIEPYTMLTQQYLEKSGLRVITIWDEISENQAEAYADNCRHLYGLTLEDWQKHEKILPFNKNGRLAILPNRPCYESDIHSICRHWKDTVRHYTGDYPMFLTAQGVSWKLGPKDIAELRDSLEAYAPGKIVISRGDHFFSFYNEDNGLDYNLTMSKEIEIQSSNNANNEFVSDGSSSPGHQWIDAGNDSKWIIFDFKREYDINRYVIRHAGFSGEDYKLNTKGFSLYLSQDMENWTLVDKQRKNSDDVSDIDFPAAKARYAKIIIDNPGKDNTARIGDIEIYGRK